MVTVERCSRGAERPPRSPEHLLTAAEIAENLNVSIRSVRRLIADGKLPIVRIGRSVRIRPEVLKALIEGE